MQQEEVYEDFVWRNPIYETCRICGKRIDVCELCEECAKGNEPFITSKYNDLSRW